MQWENGQRLMRRRRALAEDADFAALQLKGVVGVGLEVYGAAATGGIRASGDVQARFDLETVIAHLNVGGGECRVDAMIGGLSGTVRRDAVDRKLEGQSASGHFTAGMRGCGSHCDGGHLLRLRLRLVGGGRLRDGKAGHPGDERQERFSCVSSDLR